MRLALSWQPSWHHWLCDSKSVVWAFATTFDFLNVGLDRTAFFRSMISIAMDRTIFAAPISFVLSIFLAFLGSLFGIVVVKVF
jgi:hypothetical protein